MYLIDELMEPSPENRPKNVQIVLQRIELLSIKLSVEQILSSMPSLYNYETLKEVAEEAKKRLLVVTHWHAKDSPNPEFVKQAYDVWQGQVSWRTALAYDATLPPIAALKKSQGKRSGVQQELADPKFETSGAMGKIRFQENGDRHEQIQELTTVVAKDDGGYQFVFIKEASPLECDRH